LIKPLQFCGAVASGLIRLYRFAYSAVQTFAKSQAITNLVPWHRLSISGTSAVDALVFAIWRSPLGVWQLKNARADSKLAFGSIIASLLTCVELPTVGNMVRCCRRELVMLFDNLITATQSLLLKRTFLGIYGLLRCYGNTPMHHLFGKWMMQQGAVKSYRQLVDLSPMDPVFPALLREIVSEVATDFYITATVVNKALFSGPSLAATSSLGILARAIDFNEFVCFCESEIDSKHFLPAVYLLTHIEKSVLDDPRVVAADTRIVREVLQSESPFSIDQIESFTKNLHLPELVAICNGTRGKERAFLRFLLMITSVPNFAPLMENNAKLVQAFSNGVKQLLPLAKDINTLATLCIAWHSLCLLISSDNQFKTSSSII
jgi:hypothetical protein